VRTFDLQTSALDQGGEYVLGMKDLHSQACYLVFGVLQAGEGDRLVKPGAGHEEILCAMDGSLTIHTGHGDALLPRGHAVHIKENESFLISNPSDDTLIYILAGGRVV
jgi:hypothetical protein